MLKIFHLILCLWMHHVRGSNSAAFSSHALNYAAEAPTLGTFSLLETSAHDTSCFTQGYFIKDGYLYESCGLYGHSSLKKIDLKTGAVVKHYKDFSSKVFVEGITVLGERLYALTWESRHLYVFDTNLKHLFTTRFHTHKGEGWGLTNDGEHLIATDGSNRIMYLSVPKDESDEAKRVKELIVMDSENESIRLDLRENEIKNLNVRDSKGEVKHLNDLELVEGLLYLNVWYKDVVVVVDPEAAQPANNMVGVTKGVETSVVFLKSKIDMSDLYPMQRRLRNVDCLNGIAYDPEKKEFHLTGKLWPHKYRVKLSLQGGTAKSKGGGFQKKRRRRRTKTDIVFDRDLKGFQISDAYPNDEGDDIIQAGSSSNGGFSRVKVPEWLPGLVLATGLSCLFISSLLVLLVWIERGFDDSEAQRYQYIPVTSMTAGALSLQHQKRSQSGRDKSSNVFFRTGEGDEEEGVEMQMAFDSSNRYTET